MNRSKFYFFILAGCLAGYIWLAIAGHDFSHKLNVCLFKQITHIPCPSCGSTRSVMALTDGNIKDAWHLNPIGLLLACSLILFPCWCVYDLSFKKQTLFQRYQQLELLWQNKRVAIPFVLLMAINWVWNIWKGI